MHVVSFCEVDGRKEKRGWGDLDETFWKRLGTMVEAKEGNGKVCDVEVEMNEWGLISWIHGSVAN